MGKMWQRQKQGGGDYGDAVVSKSGFYAPRDDINAPDLYIPSMAFISYILLIGLAMGLSDRYAHLHRRLYS